MLNDKVEKLDKDIKRLKGTESVQVISKKSNLSALSVSTDLLAGVAVGSFTGYYLDRYFQMSPILLLIGVMFGFVIAFRLIWKEMNK